MNIIKPIYFYLSLFFRHVCVKAQNTGQVVVTGDLTHFWEAYDHILSTIDSCLQYAYSNDLFIARRTPGLKAIMQLKGYTPQSYIAERSARHPAASHTLSQASPGKLYFAVRAFKTGGTSLDSLVLIGSEISMVDHQTELSEIGR